MCRFQVFECTTGQKHTLRHHLMDVGCVYMTGDVITLAQKYDSFFNSLLYMLSGEQLLFFFFFSKYFDLMLLELFSRNSCLSHDLFLFFNK